MPDNSTPAAPPSGAPDGPPPPGASQPGRRGAAPCRSQYLDERAEVIHQCARERDHDGLHASRQVRGSDRSWSNQQALGYVDTLLRRQEGWR